MMKGSTVKSMVKAGGLVTDKEWPIYLFGLTREEGADWLIRKVQGFDLSAITLDMLNAVTHKLSERWRDEVEETGEMPAKILQQEFEEMWAEHGGCIQVVIRESEIRKYLKKDYPKEFIYRHMFNIGHISLEGNAPVAWERDKKGKFHWSMRNVAGGFADVFCLSDPPYAVPEELLSLRLPPRTTGRWKGTEEDVFVVRFIGTWGRGFAASVLNYRVRMMPERFYKYLSVTSKMLFRVVSGTKYSPITLTDDQCSDILGWTQKTTNPTLRRTLITSAFEEQVKYLLINSFEEGPEGKPTTYWKIFKKKNWFHPPELKKGE